MRLLDSFVSGFINVFGITQPSEAARRRASSYIGVLLVLMAVVLAVAGATIFKVMRR
jgi:hypothetical protein